VNPRVGLTVAALPGLTLRASGAKAYLVPAPAYQFEGFNDHIFPGAGSIGAIPNTDLKPEDYFTFEGGATAVLGHGAVLIDLSAFHTSNNNYLLRQRILRDPKNVPYTPTIGTKDGLVVTEAAAIFTSENGGRVRAYGGELFVAADLFSRLRSWASYSLALGSQDEQPTRTGTGINTGYLANQAAHQVKGGAELRIGAGLYLSPSVVWYSRTRIRPDAADQALVASGLDPFTLVNLSIVWELEHWQLWLRAQNLFDVRHYRPGGPVSQQAATQVPQFGATGQVGFRVLY
jgi:outer membrane receptor protein involved in Fe transport